MPLVKKYDYNATREAIERADGKCINSYKMVRNDVSVNDWGKKISNKNIGTQRLQPIFNGPGIKMSVILSGMLKRRLLPANPSTWTSTQRLWSPCRF